MRCCQLPLTNGWTSSVDCIWRQQNILLQFWLHFNYVNLTNDVVTCGTPKAFHHRLVIIKIKSKGQLCCKYNGQCNDSRVNPKEPNKFGLTHELSSHWFDSWHKSLKVTLQQQGAILQSEYHRKQQRKKFPKARCCEP